MGQLALNLPDNRGGNPAPEAPVRLIHYLGNKSRLIAAIRAIVDEVSAPGALACDLFSGTGVVAAGLAKSRPVVAVDIQEYARVLAAALLSDQPVELTTFEDLVRGSRSDEFGTELRYCLDPLIESEAAAITSAKKGNPERLADMLEAGSLISLQFDGRCALPLSVRSSFTESLARLESAGLDKSRLTTATRYFGGLFFGFRQAIEIDLIAARLDTLPFDLRDAGKAALLSTASEATSSVGNQFAQPIRPRTREGHVKHGALRNVVASTNVDIVQGFLDSVERLCRTLPVPSGSTAVRADYQDFLHSTADPIGVFYVDPPYTRDHYSRFYHVLETLCLRDNPDVSSSNLNGGSRISRGAYRDDRHQSPFCIRSAAPQAFEALFRSCRRFDAPVVLSYSPHSANGRSHPRVMRTEKIIEIAEKFYGRVRVETVDNVVHSKLNKSQLQLETRDLAEILIVCLP